MASDEAAARAARPAQPAAVPARRPSLASYFQEHDEHDELTEASNAVVDMVQAGNLDAAEQAAHDLLARFPDVHDGYDRLGMVCEARGDHRQAADYYRKAINVIRDHPDNYDPEFEAVFQRLVDQARNPGGRRRRLSLPVRPPLQPRRVLGGVKASTPAARSLLDPACAPGGQKRRSAPRNGPSVSPRNDPKERPHGPAKIREGHDPQTLKFRDQKTPITHPLPCSGSAWRGGRGKESSSPAISSTR